MIEEKLSRVKTRIAEAARRAGRDPGSVRLIAVTKAASLEQVREIIELGVNDVGENRVKDALAKKSLLDSHILNWHMIGHLQSNKAKEAVKTFSVIHSVHSIKLAHIIDNEAKKENRIQDILVEVNVSGEASKFGIRPDELSGFLDEAHALKHVNILGLMTMAPLSESAENSRPFFKALKGLAAEHHLKELSMGMTQDFEVAVEEGATMVRIGTEIFGEDN